MKLQRYLNRSSSKLNLPNVLAIKLGKVIGLNPFLNLFGIQKVERISSPEFIQMNSNKMERYIKFQQIRLMRLREEGEPERFWKVALNILEKSKAFRMLALRNVKPNWYKEMKFEEVKRQMRKLNGICYRPDPCFEINRRSIPKPDGSLRWINDPGIA